MHLIYIFVIASGFLFGCKSTPDQAELKDAEVVDEPTESGDLGSASLDACIDLTAGAEAREGLEQQAKAALVDAKMNVVLNELSKSAVLIDQLDKSSPFFGATTPFGANLIRILTRDLELKINVAMESHCQAARPIATLMALEIANIPSVALPKVWSSTTMSEATLSGLKVGDTFVAERFLSGKLHETPNNGENAQLLIAATAAAPVGWLDPDSGERVLFSPGSQFKVVAVKNLQTPTQRQVTLKQLDTPTHAAKISAVPEAFDEMTPEEGQAFAGKVVKAGKYSGTFNGAACTVVVDVPQPKVVRFTINPGQSVFFAAKERRLTSQSGGSVDVVPKRYFIDSRASLGDLSLIYTSKSVKVGGDGDEDSDQERLVLGLEGGNAIRSLTVVGKDEKASRCYLSSPLPFKGL